MHYDVSVLYVWCPFCFGRIQKTFFFVFFELSAPLFCQRCFKILLRHLCEEALPVHIYIFTLIAFYLYSSVPIQATVDHISWQGNFETKLRACVFGFFFLQFGSAMYCSRIIDLIFFLQMVGKFCSANLSFYRVFYSRTVKNQFGLVMRPCLPIGELHKIGNLPAITSFSSKFQLLDKILVGVDTIRHGQKMSATIWND